MSAETPKVTVQFSWSMTGSLVMTPARSLMVKEVIRASELSSPLSLAPVYFTATSIAPERLMLIEISPFLLNLPATVALKSIFKALTLII